MSPLSASWPTFVRPSLRTYERGKTRDEIDVYAATSDLTLKISWFSKDTESTQIHPRTQKPKGDSVFFYVFFFFLSFSEMVGRPQTSRMPSDTSCGSDVFRVQCGRRYGRTSNGCVLHAVPMPPPRPPVVVLCSTRVCSGACDKRACDS
jgi:hypothetical protein